MARIARNGQKKGQIPKDPPLQNVCKASLSKLTESLLLLQQQLHQQQPWLHH